MQTQCGNCCETVSEWDISHILLTINFYFFPPKELNDSLRHLFNLIIKLTGVFGGKQISKQMNKHTDKAQQSSGYVL